MRSVKTNRSEPGNWSSIRTELLEWKIRTRKELLNNTVENVSGGIALFLLLPAVAGILGAFALIVYSVIDQHGAALVIEHHLSGRIIRK